MKKLLYIIILLGILVAIAPLHLQRAVFRQFSDVTDYQFFDNDTIRANGKIGWPAKIEKKPSSAILNKIEDMKSLAFLVIQNDTIRYEQYWRGYGADSKSGSFSMAKSVVSLLMGIAIAEGKVSSIEDYVSNYIDAFNKAGTDTIRIRHLLAMSAGFNWKESYENPFGKTAQSYYGDNLKTLIGSLEAARTPGVSFQYSSNETQILAWVIENAYQQRLSDLVEEKIWLPIGAEQDALWSLDQPNGTIKAFCCLNSNARDFARLGKLVLQQGRWEDQQIVPAAYIAAATSPASWLKDKNGKPVDFYGYQFWIMEYKGIQIPYFRGVLGQFIFVIPEKNAVVVRLGEGVTKSKKHVHSPDVYTYLDAAWEILN
jgi:CubicO group peptidase (beta-lactamase class C family)